MFEIRIICSPDDVPVAAQAILGSVDALSARRYDTRDGNKARLYITADPRSSHADCTQCDGNGTCLWFTPDGREERRPCTGIDDDSLLAAGLTTGGRRREPWHRPGPHMNRKPQATGSPWPTPEDAYDKAPSIVTEIGWIARTARHVIAYGEKDREFYLRKAAVFDRIALTEEPELPGGTAIDSAMNAAFALLDLDQARTPGDVRGYVRQQYQHWREQQYRAEHGEGQGAVPEPCGESGCLCYGVGEEHADHACGCDCPRDAYSQLIHDDL